LCTQYTLRKIDESTKKKESCERPMAGAFLLITPLFLRPERNNVSCNSSETAEVYSYMCTCMRMLYASKYAPFIAPAMIRRYAVNRSCFSTKLSLLLRHDVRLDKIEASPCWLSLWFSFSLPCFVLPLSLAKPQDFLNIRSTRSVSIRRHKTRLAQPR